MKLDRAFLKYFLIYALLIISGLAAVFALENNAVQAFKQNHFLNPVLLVILSIAYWLAVLILHSQQKNRQSADSHINLKRTRLALDAAHEAFWDWSLNPQQDIYFSESYCEILGYSQAEFGSNQQAWQGHLLAEERERVYRNVMNYLADGEGSYDSTYRMRHKDGTPRWIRSRGSAIRDAEGQPIRFIGIARDITEQRGSEERAKQAQAVFESTHEGILVTDHTNTIVHINPAFTQITGYTPDDVLGKTPRMFKSGRHTAEFYRSMWTTLESTDQWSGEIWNRRKSGEILPQYQTIRLIRDENGLISHNVAIFSDISVLKDSQSELSYLAHYDPLTGLANRTQLYDRLKHSLRSAIARETNCSFFLIDLDHFKNINESLGHSLGDQLLQAVAQRMAKILDEQSSLARFGGDEFAIISESISTPEKAAALAQKIIHTQKEPFIIGDNQLFINLSIGICFYPLSVSSVEEIMRNADSALSKAKASGRDTFAFYSSELTEQAFQRIRIASELHQALDADRGLELYYQPVYTMDKQQLVGCEALLRWNHPERGLVPPNEFIPIAEESGLITAIDQWVLRQACQQIHAWQQQDLALQFVAVNVSSRSLSNRNLPAQVTQILQDSTIVPQRLELEVTESAVMENPQQADEILIELRELGVRLAIDDFGTGYSSLSRLKSLPVHKLKIDQSFVSNLPYSIEDIAIVRAILALGNSLGLEIQAEGIETTEQMQFLQEQNCPLGQGYLFGRPVPIAAFNKLLVDNSTVKV